MSVNGTSSDILYSLIAVLSSTAVVLTVPTLITLDGRNSDRGGITFPPVSRMMDAASAESVLVMRNSLNASPTLFTSAPDTGLANTFIVHTSPPGMELCACVMLVLRFQK